MTSSTRRITGSAFRRVGLAACVSASILALFLGFYRNQWNVVREKRFKEFQLDSESLVIARMVESRQHGILSHNGLLGWGDVNPNDLNEADYQHQYDVFLSQGTFATYSLYKSAGGWQAFLFSALHSTSPFAPAVDLRNFRALVALLLAAVLGAFIGWSLRELGWVTAIVLLGTTIVSQWITLFGHNLFYFIWASFLPLTLSAWYLSLRSPAQSPSFKSGFFAVVFGSVLFKCLANGYDFIIPALAMPATPLVYYAVKHRWRPRQLVELGLVLVVAIVAAVVASIAVLAIQLEISEGSFLGGLASILSTFGRRTYADPALFPGYAESLRANPWSVLWTYVAEDSAIGILGMRFLDLILLAGCTTLLYLALERLRPKWFPSTSNTAHALIATTWLSLLSPVLWFVVFKGQAYVHTHTNYLAWHMPFALFAYMLCTWLTQQILLGPFVRPRPGPRTPVPEQ